MTLWRYNGITHKLNISVHIHVIIIDLYMFSVYIYISMFLTQFLCSIIQISDWWQFNSNKQLNRGPKWKAPKLRAKQKQRALENLPETPTALSNRLTKGRHSVLGHHMVSSPSSANDACLLFVESEFFWTFHDCWKASGRSIQVLLYVPRVCFVCRGSLFDAGDRDTPWSFHARVRPAFRDAEKNKAHRTQPVLACIHGLAKTSICTQIWRGR